MPKNTALSGPILSKNCFEHFTFATKLTILKWVAIDLPGQKSLQMFSHSSSTNEFC